MATAEALLALLLPSPRHGYDLKRAHDDWFAGFRPLAFGQVYSTLSRLQRDRLIQVAHTETGEGPERVVYELTASGQERARAWLSDPVAPGTGQSDELIRKTIAAHRLNADPQGLMARQRTAHLRGIRALEPAAPVRPGAVPPTRSSLSLSLLADYARLHLDAELRWLELAAERIQLAGPTPDAWSSSSATPAQSYLYDAHPSTSNGFGLDEAELDQPDYDQPALNQAESDQGARS